MISDQITDEELLTSGEPADFGLFYRRHVREVLGYMMRRTGDPEAAADLTAETFAAAIVARRRFRPGGAPAGAWLIAIAHHRLVDFQRRGQAETRACRRLALERPPLDGEDEALIRTLGGDATLGRLQELPADQRAAIEAHVLEEREYADIASELGLSDTAVRMRVSRGLATLRRLLGNAR